MTNRSWNRPISSRMRHLGLRLCLIGALAGFTACDSLIMTEPQNDISPVDLFKGIDSYDAALRGVYSIMAEPSGGGYHNLILTLPEAVSDNLVAHTGFSFDAVVEFIYPLAYQGDEYQFEQFWRGLYSAIANVNNIIKYVSTSREGTEAQRAAILGEALGLRALLHYDLYRFFGKSHAHEPDALAVPYRTVSTMDEAASGAVPPRLPNREFIPLLLEDLKRAEELATNSVGSDRLSLTGIRALAARVALEIQDYEGAATAARAALQDSRYSLSPGSEFADQWVLDDSEEIIFRMRYTAVDGANLFNGQLFANPEMFNYPYQVSSDLIDLFDPADIRPATYFADEGTFLYPTKYSGGRPELTTDFTRGNDIKLFRVPELYLIIAEAEYELGREGPALEALNTLRAARQLPEINLAGSDLLAEILDERRRELFLEGLRFYDLKRLNLGFTRADGTSLNPGDNRFAFPIPQIEVERSGIEPNPGY